MFVHVRVIYKRILDKATATDVMHVLSTNSVMFTWTS